MDLTGREVVGGLDLSSVGDLTALVLVSTDILDGVVHHVVPVAGCRRRG
jgi:phage terminase large subunit-like protein